MLNDKQIRQLCLVPTHTYGEEENPHLLSFTNDNWYSLKSGGACLNEGELLDADILTPLCESVLTFAEDRMISPFEPNQVRYDKEGTKIISYGTSSMGYDVRLGNKFKIFTNLFNALIDPLDMPENAYVDHEGDFVIIPGNSYVLGHTVEYFRMPEDTAAICVGKSTYARAGCAINVTPIEPGFHGNVVIEIANQTPLPMKVYANMGIAQFIFFKGDPCEVSYATRSGKYQGQTGIQTAIV